MTKKILDYLSSDEFSKECSEVFAYLQGLMDGNHNHNMKDKLQFLSKLLIINKDIKCLNIRNNNENIIKDSFEKYPYDNIEKQSYNNTEKQSYNNTEKQSYNNTEKQSYNNIEKQSYNNTEKQHYDSFLQKKEEINNIQPLITQKSAPIDKNKEIYRGADLSLIEEKKKPKTFGFDFGL
jgi:hypothetical protein